MTKIDIVFCKSNQILGKLIQWRTYGDWSHCAIGVSGSDMYVEASFWGGVRNTNLSNLKHGNDVEIVTIDVDCDLSTALNILASEIGKPYDYLALFGAYFRTGKWAKNNAWYCSELVSYCLARMGLSLFGDNEPIITPTMLYIALKSYLEGKRT